MNPVNTSPRAATIIRDAVAKLSDDLSQTELCKGAAISLKNGHATTQPVRGGWFGNGRVCAKRAQKNADVAFANQISHFCDAYSGSSIPEVQNAVAVLTWSVVTAQRENSAIGDNDKLRDALATLKSYDPVPEGLPLDQARIQVRLGADPFQAYAKVDVNADSHTGRLFRDFARGAPITGTMSDARLLIEGGFPAKEVYARLYADPLDLRARMLREIANDRMTGISAAEAKMLIAHGADISFVCNSVDPGRDDDTAALHQFGNPFAPITYDQVRRLNAMGVPVETLRARVGRQQGETAPHAPA